MKIGIITFQNAHNWGAILQLYALKTYLQDQGHNVKVINYINPAIAKKYTKERKIDYKVTDIKSSIKVLFKVVNNIYSKKQYLRKWQLFDDFIKKYILDNDIKKYNKDDIEKLNLDYIICGSDQIWNPNLTDGLDETYFGAQKEKIKNISYAASMGIKELPQEEEIKFKRYIKKLNSISVREQTLKDYIERITDKKVEKVLDPTLLLDKSKYEEIEGKIDNKNYLLIYTLEKNKKLLKIAKFIAKQKGLKIIELSYEKDLRNLGHKQVADIGPREFLGLIKNAKFVITNSFHGTVFSIILNKQFYTIPVEKVNSRIEEILKITGLEQRQINYIEEINLEKEIKFDSVIEKLKTEQDKSKTFLKKSLEK